MLSSGLLAGEEVVSVLPHLQRPPIYPYERAIHSVTFAVALTKPTWIWTTIQIQSDWNRIDFSFRILFNGDWITAGHFRTSYVTHFIIHTNLSVTYRLPRLRNSFTEMGIVLLVINYICNYAKIRVDQVEIGRVWLAGLTGAGPSPKGWVSFSINPSPPSE